MWQAARTHFLEPFSQKSTKCSLENGHDRYAVLDMEEYRQYEKLMAMQKLMTELEKGRRSGGEQGYFSAEDVEKELGIHD